MQAASTLPRPAATPASGALDAASERPSGADTVASHPGEAGLFVGQRHVYMVLAVYLGLRYGRSRPLVAGLALALALCKPTLGAPCALFMLVRREWRAVLTGCAAAGVVSLGVLVFLAHAAGGATAFVTSLLRASAAWGSYPDQDAAASVSRVDALALVAHLLGRQPGELVALGVTALLALVPTLGLLGGRISVSRGVRGALLVTLAVPAFNCVSSVTGVSMLDPRGPWLLVLSSSNGVASLLRFAACAALSLRPQGGGAVTLQPA